MKIKNFSKLILFLLFIMTSLNFTFANTVSIDVSTATGTGAGALPTVLQTDDNNYYDLTKNSDVHVQSFDVTGQTGTINSVTLYIRFYVDSGYLGTNYFQYSTNDGSTYTNTNIKPTGSDTSEVQKSSSIPVTTWTAIGNLDIYFYNNDGASPDHTFVDRIWLVVDYTPDTICGDANCNGVETYLSCPQDCCDNDCTATTDSICHSACDTYNGCTFSDANAKTVCDGQSSSSSICYSGEATIICCEGVPNTCTGCYDCSSGSCSVDDDTECSNTETSCGCSSGSCTSCSYGQYCGGYACLSCSTTCDNICQDSSCYSIDPDCDSDGGLGGICCGDSTCDSGEECSIDCQTETNCADGVDNDEDGFIDSIDSDCGGTETSCSDEIDNDGDGLIDCADSVDCPTNTACATGICCSESCVSASCSLDSQCDDSNACTIDVCSNAGTCSASCLNTAIVSCTNEDGCCPSGCTALDDSDCGTACGNNACEPGETYSNCPADCCDADGTSTTDSICHSSCPGVDNECNDVDVSSQSCTSSGEGYCNNLCQYTECSGCYDCSSGSCSVDDDTECLASEYCSTGVCTPCPPDACGDVDSGVVNGGIACSDAEGITLYDESAHCIASCSICTGCYDCSSGSCSLNDNSECDGNSDSCYCSSGTCESLNFGYYCSSYTPIACSTLCDGSCPSAECYGTDPDCDASGNLKGCCGDTLCNGTIGESCSNCEADCGVCPANCGDGTCDADENSCTCPADCGICSGLVEGFACAEYQCRSGECISVSISNCCGNNICEAGESSTTCSIDCTECNDNDECTVDTYDYGTQKCVYTPITPCCGNGDCEGGETYLSCPVDCTAGTTSGNITIIMSSPDENQLFAGGSNILIKSTIYVGNAIGKNLNVKASGFFGETSLYDTGNYNDEDLNDGIYANSIVVDKSVTEGDKEITITVNSKSKTRTIKVNKTLIINLNTNNETYNKGDVMEIKGNIENAVGDSAQNGNVTITLSSGSIVQTAKTSLQNGLFYYKYNIPFGIPEGNWKISASAIDIYKNQGEKIKYITIKTPSAVELQYNVQILSPAEGVIYTRGEKIPISIKILEVGNPVEGVNVSFVSPSGERIFLKPTTSGSYAGEYELSYTEPAGDWSLIINGQKVDGGELKAGGAYIPIRIEPAKLNIKLENIPKSSLTNEKLTIKAKITYPDGTAVSNADLAVISPDNQTLHFDEVGDGVYELNFLSSNKDAGLWNFKITGLDSSSNIIQSDIIQIKLIEKTPIQQATSFIKAYWWGFTLGAILILIISRKKIILTYVKSKEKNIKEKINLIKQQKKDAEKEYFQKGAISRKDYKELIRKYNERLSELRKNLSELKSKHKKK